MWTELKKIEDYWSNKYPNVDIRLWSNEYETKYYGQVMLASTNLNFEADTIGRLINLGEDILRMNK